MHYPLILLFLQFFGSAVAGQALYGNSFGVPGVDAQYDYVVIGGGTAGNVMAARLAEDTSSSVAVIEAGGFYEQDNGNGSVIPSLCFGEYTGSNPNDTQPLIDWGFVTTPQAGAANRVMHYARGKSLGGSSARNYLAYQRGTAGSYQRWADMVGDQSYTFSNFLPYFKRSAHFTPPNTALRAPNASVGYDPSAYNNTVGGPLHVSYPVFADSFQTWARVAMQAVGLGSIGGSVSGKLIGSDLGATTINPEDETRSSSQTSYLDQAIAQTSLKVYTHALAKKINFSGNNTATSVTVDTAGKLYTISARKEIILSAGAFQSPQLLMVSGVGPSDILEAYNISIISNLPGVGQNMQDQPFASTSFRVNLETSSKMVNDPAYAARAAEQYLSNRTGPYTDASAFIGWEKIPEPYRSNFSNTTLSALAQFPGDWPELEYLAANSIFGNNGDYMTSDPADGYNYASFASVLAAPLSRGNISINSSDMADPPLINPNWLTHQADVEVMVAGFKRTRDMWSAISNVTIGPEYYPGTDYTTDAEILQQIRETMIMLYHAACTCSMGTRGDPKAVVDTHGKVFGVNRLRVVDASIFPLLPPGHPQSTVYALAEKIAEDVRLGR